MRLVAARRICEALRAAGVEVWFDQSELRGGDAWDQKIRKQIKECALFVPVVSAATQARTEGYFRLEWRLADQRTHLMAKGRPFLLPVVVDATRDDEAHVPDSFTEVQWTRLPAGETTPAFCEGVRVLLGVSGMKAERPVQQGESIATPKKSRAPITLGVVVAVVLLGVAGVFAWRGKVPAVPPPGAGDKSVAVLPFLNRSGDPNQEYFSDGLTEEILGALRRERDLTVPGNTSCFAFKGRNVPAAEIAQALNVSRLVEGSVQRDGSRVRIRITLSQPGNNSSEELGTFTEELTDIFALQEKVARAVVAKLALRSTTAPIAVATRNPAAYDAFLRGRALQTASQSATGYLGIIKLYEEAVRLDPDFAMAWARMAQVFSWILSGGFDRSPETKAKAAAAAALRLAPRLPEALLAVAIVRLQVDRDLEAAQRALDELERRAPNDAEALVVRADLERDRGNWGESLIRIVARAVELDPQNTNRSGKSAM